MALLKGPMTLTVDGAPVFSLEPGETFECADGHSMPLGSGRLGIRGTTADVASRERLEQLERADAANRERLAELAKNLQATQAQLAAAKAAPVAAAEVSVAPVTPPVTPRGSVR